MKVKPYSILVGLLLSVLVLGAAGCGSKKAASSVSSSTDTTMTTSSSSTASSTTAASSDLTTKSNCAGLAGLDASLTRVTSGAGGNELAKDQALLHEFADQAPSEIRPAFKTVVDAVDKIATALKGVNLSAPTAADLSKLTALSGQLDQNALAKADKDIAAWVAKNC